MDGIQELFQEDECSRKGFGHAAAATGHGFGVPNARRVTFGSGAIFPSCTAHGGCEPSTLHKSVPRSSDSPFSEPFSELFSELFSEPFFDSEESSDEAEVEKPADVDESNFGLSSEAEGKLQSFSACDRFQD